MKKSEIAHIILFIILTVLIVNILETTTLVLYNLVSDEYFNVHLADSITFLGLMIIYIPVSISYKKHEKWLLNNELKLVHRATTEKTSVKTGVAWYMFIPIISIFYAFQRKQIKEYVSLAVVELGLLVIFGILAQVVVNFGGVIGVGIFGIVGVTLAGLGIYIFNDYILHVNAWTNKDFLANGYGVVHQSKEEAKYLKTIKNMNKPKYIFWR